MTLIEKVISEVKAWTIERRRMGSHEPRHDEVLVEEVERLRQENAKLRSLRTLFRELDEELDGVRIPKSAAAIMNGIRAKMKGCVKDE